MSKWLGKWLKVYEDEFSLFLWAAVLYFLIRSASIVFDNFADTAFLKRFGVEYLPLVYMANSVSTFFLMGVITGIMARTSGSRLLSYLFLVCGGSVAALRFVIPLGFDLIYPLLFILKAQYEVLLALVFWNLANDLFNTRQSKRLFPLITAGGVLGGIAGSFATPLLTRAIRMDNLMLAYLVLSVLGAFFVHRMGIRFPTLLLAEKTPRKGKARATMVSEFRKVLPLLKESRLVQILVILTLVPNMVIPIMNYQFNFAVDQSFATEGAMIRFFALFNGSLNVVSLVILLFVGRIYGRWGLPVALMFHPFNYVLAFLALLLRFDVFSAMYARISTAVLRNTINNPARNVLMGLFPESYRSAIRPFLRGTVVRIGILAGAGVIMLSERFVHPRFLSLAAVAFVGVWILSSFALKKNYANILLDLISRNMLDLKSLEDKDIGQVFGDKQAQSQLVRSFLAAEGEDCLWYGRLLQSLGVANLDTHILSALPHKDNPTRIGLLGLLAGPLPEGAGAALSALAESRDPELLVALAEASRGLPEGAGLQRKIFEHSPDPTVRAHAVTGLYQEDPGRYRQMIQEWLASENGDEKRAGILAAGGTGDEVFREPLLAMLAQTDDAARLPLLLESLSRIGPAEASAKAAGYFSHPQEEVRRAALEAFRIENDEGLRSVISLLGDPADAVTRLAAQKIETSTHQNPLLLVESLANPRRRLREGIFELLESMNIKALEVFRFARGQIELSYGHIAETQALEGLPEGPERAVLKDHLDQKRLGRLDNVLRVLAAQDRSGRLRYVWRGIFSANDRQRSNSIEALEDLIDPALARILIPLLEDAPLDRRLAAGRKYFKVRDFRAENGVVAHLLGSDDWVSVVLTLHLLGKCGLTGRYQEALQALQSSSQAEVQRLLAAAIEPRSQPAAQEEVGMEARLSIPEKILYLRKIHIFEGLAVSELAAIASVTEEADYPAGEVVIRQGEPGETLYLIIKGEVSVHKRLSEDEADKEVELDRIAEGDYFGEMALFEDSVRSATIRTAADSRFLFLHKREFTEIVREYPQIALHICKVLSARLLKLHAKVRTAGE